MTAVAPPAILLMGPTAAGKSELALRRAERQAPLTLPYPLRRACTA